MITEVTEEEKPHLIEEGYIEELESRFAKVWYVQNHEARRPQGTQPADGEGNTDSRREAPGLQSQRSIQGTGQREKRQKEEISRKALTDDGGRSYFACHN